MHAMQIRTCGLHSCRLSRRMHPSTSLSQVGLAFQPTYKQTNVEIIAWDNVANSRPALALKRAQIIFQFELHFDIKLSREYIF